VGASFCSRSFAGRGDHETIDGMCGTGITGGIAAAVAGGKLPGLDLPRMCWTIGIALSQTSGYSVIQGKIMGST
jgi:hypothetical protein